MAEEVNTEEESGRPVLRQGGKIFLILLFFLFNIGAAWWIADRYFEDVYEFVYTQFQPDPANYEFEEVIVNPAGTMGQRYLVVQIGVELSGEEHLSLIEENTQEIRHGMHEVLSSRTLEELDDRETRDRMRYEIAELIHDAIGHRSVRNLYYTRYVMQ